MAVSTEVSGGVIGDTQVIWANERMTDLLRWQMWDKRRLTGRCGHYASAQTIFQASQYPGGFRTKILKRDSENAKAWLQVMTLPFTSSESLDKLLSLP